LREMDAAGVNRAVLVPPFLDGDRNDLVLEAARLYPTRLAAMGRLDLEDPASRDRIATWRDQPGMLGFRYSFHRPAIAHLLAERRVDWLWERSEKSGVPIMVYVDHSVLHHIDDVAARYPNLKLAMCHMSLPLRKKDEDAFRGLDNLLALAKRPNVSVKVSALPCYTTDPYPYRTVHPYVRRVYDAFGPKRMFWGSDLSRLPSTAMYRQAVTLFTEAMPWLSAGDLEWIMGRALNEWLGWNP
ncbi:MAG TPA: amidohydrolase family protein, partial [Burkholderiales bacterium]|nr:amidohydrolase family protein [Burkholderiales bacterium]